MLKKKWILFVGILLFIVVFNSAGDFLVIDEKPVKSDVIIVLSGGDGRLEKGVQLYKEGYAPYLMLSNGSVQQLYERALELGVPNEAIIMEVKSDSTLDNAIFSEEIVRNHKFESAIVVSSGFHMRRVKILYDKVFQNSGVRLTYVAEDMTAYNPKIWWADEVSRDNTFREYIKLVGNLIGLHGSDSKEFLRKFDL
ncbi:YdcF family protein [Psychrobacillus sp. FJAT-51614]|uniref:YdcF family protein n=1 Tax=Psychrobacillus mangrovi TaxID=3117745 RepID=A0ABU8F192_9BACI